MKNKNILHLNTQISISSYFNAIIVLFQRYPMTNAVFNHLSYSYKHADAISAVYNKEFNIYCLVYTTSLPV